MGSRLRRADGSGQTGRPIPGSPSRREPLGLGATLDALDMGALHRDDKEGFVASLGRAEAAFGEQVAGVAAAAAAARLTAVEPDLEGLRQTIARARGRGAWNPDWLANAVPRALAEAEAILQDRSLQVEVPRYETGPVEIRNGAFWQDERPMVFVGMGHFSQVRNDIPIFADYGFNIAQITIGVGSVLRGEDTVDEQPIEQVLAVLDRAAQANVAVDVLLEPHGWPGWANEKYPEPDKGGQEFLTYRIDHPRAQEILEKYFSILIPRLAGHPALFS